MQVPHGICVTIQRVGGEWLQQRPLFAVGRRSYQSKVALSEFAQVTSQFYNSRSSSRAFVHTHTHTLIVVTLFFLDAHFFCGKLMFDIVHDVGTFAGRATTRHGQSESYTSTVNKSTFHFPLCPAMQLVLMCCVFLDVRTGV